MSSDQVLPGRSAWKKPLSVMLWMLCLGILMALAIRLTIQDAYRWGDLIFYATPLPLLVAGTVVIVLGSMVLKCWKRSAAGILLLAGLIPWWMAQDWKVPSSPPVTAGAGAIRVLFWNVARKPDLSAALETIGKIDADIVGLVEVEGDPADRRKEFQSVLPQYNVSVLGGNLYLLARGTSGDSNPVTLDGSSIARHVPVRVGDQEWQIVLVDIYGNPFRPRGTALSNLAELCSPMSDSPLIVMGDFNLPADSVHLKKLKTDHRELFDVVGRGYAPTWPVPIPIMQLDQFWVNGQVVPVAIRKWSSFASDHCAIEATVQIRDPE